MATPRTPSGIDATVARSPVVAGEVEDAANRATPSRTEPVDRPGERATSVAAAGQDDERWRLAWAERPLLLAMARSRVGWHEAEDVVSEALLRAQHAADVPTPALRSWLVTTTLRLCADAHRAHARDVRRGQKLAGRALTTVPGPEDEVADRDHARWLADEITRLPATQAEAITLRSAGYGVSSIAGRMGLPYKAVESLLSRARRSLRCWAAVAVGVWAFSRFLTRRTAQLHVAAAVVCAGVNLATPVVADATTSVAQHGPHHQLAPGNLHVAPVSALHLPTGEV